MLWTTMPEAPIDKYCDPRPHKGYVRATACAWQSHVDPVTKPQSTQSGTQRDLTWGIPAPSCLHSTPHLDR